MGTNKQKSFESIMLFSILLILGIFFSLMYILIWNNSNKFIKDDLSKNSEQILTISTKEIASKFKPAEEKICFISNLFSDEKRDTLQMIQTISKMMKQDSSILSSFIYLVSNEENSGFEKYYTLQKDSLVQLPLTEKMGKNYVDELINLSNTSDQVFWKVPFYHEINQEVETVVWRPIYSGRTLIGLVGFEVVLNNLLDSFNHSDIQETSFFILSQEGQLLSDFSDEIPVGTDLFEYGKNIQNKPLMNLSKLMMNGEKENAQPIQINDANLYLSFAPIESYHLSVGMCIDKDIRFAKFDGLKTYLILLAIFGIIFVFVVIHVLIKKRMTYLKEFSDVSRQIGKGSFNTYLPIIETHDEFLALKNDLHQMQQNLTDYTNHLIASTQHDERQYQEQELYQYFKKNVLEPDYRKFVFGNAGLLEFKIDYHPAKNLSGDFYDYFLFNESKICMVFGNIAGKGTTLPMFISFIMSNIRNEIHGKTNLVQFAENFNKFLYAHNENQWMIKLLLMVFDSKSKKMNFVNIGFESLYIIRNQIISSVDTMHGIAMGMVEDAKYSGSMLELHSDDTIISCSNIVPDLLNKQGVNYGKDRLEQLLNQNKNQYPIPFLQNLSSDIDLHLKGMEHTNDYSLIAIRISENPKTENISK